jgi:FtsZ-interacting cell division protein ZipA
MLPIPLPWLIVGVLVSLFGTYRVGHHYGWLERDNDMKIAIAKKNEESRKTEQKLTEQLNANASKLQETQNVINQKQSALDRAIRAGRVRLNTSSCVSAPTNPTSAATDTETRSEPDRQTNEATDAERATLLAIAEIVAQGDKNTAALNACVDAYNDVRNLLNDNKR